MARRGMADSERWLGFWIQHLDGLLELSFDAVLARNGLRRRHWEVMTTLLARPLTRAQIAEAMLSFRVAAALTQTDVVDDLVRREWADTDGAGYHLTVAGAAAHARIDGEVAAIRRLCTDGIPDAEYRAALDVLARIGANLERALLP
jgi:hypothetical protein